MRLQVGPYLRRIIRHHNICWNVDQLCSQCNGASMVPAAVHNDPMRPLGWGQAQDGVHCAPELEGPRCMQGRKVIIKRPYGGHTARIRLYNPYAAHLF